MSEDMEECVEEAIRTLQRKKMGIYVALIKNLTKVRENITGLGDDVQYSDLLQSIANSEDIGALPGKRPDDAIETLCLNLHSIYQTAQSLSLVREVFSGYEKPPTLPTGDYSHAAGAKRFAATSELEILRVLHDTNYTPQRFMF